MILTKKKKSKIASFQLFTLSNLNGLNCSLSNYGARVISLFAPDRNGDFKDIIVGYDSAEDFYTKHDAYYGATVGRYANRIKDGIFKIDDKKFQLAINNGNNALHGGVKGFDKQYWNVVSTSKNSVKFSYTSKDMEEGYPGELFIEVTYVLTDKNELEISYKATSSKKTVINVTNHAYFNLTGSTKNDILSHKLLINSDFITEVDTNVIPTGELYPVENSPFDFRKMKTIGKEINLKNEQLNLGGGYDHNFVLNSKELAAKVVDPISGRTLEVYTTEPGIQLYTGNFLRGVIGKNDEPINKRTAFCLETQHFPDSPNKPQFPSTILDVGQVFTSKTIYRLGVE
ncbi:aldose epimerase family protein [Urechidicola sp. KH5]